MKPPFIALILFAVPLFADSSLLELDADRATDLEMEAQSDGKRMSARREAYALQKDVLNGKLAKRTDKAIGAILARTVRELNKRKHYYEAERIEHEWRVYHRGFIYAIQASGGRDVGDHPGLKFLIDVHKKAEDLLGETLCRGLRIHDLWTLAYTIPLVFKCNGNYFIDLEEYTKHLSPFVGIIGYWGAFIACSAATSGIGAFFVCPILSKGVEVILVRYIVPRIDNPLFKRACGKSEKVPPT